MEIKEIIKDAFVYPLRNMKALVIYSILGIILGVAVIETITGVATLDNPLAGAGTGIIGIVIALIIAFVISGYELDIVKCGIIRTDSAPGIDIARQFTNGVKLLAVTLAYFATILFFSACLLVLFPHWISTVIIALLFIIFALPAFMGHCRLAESEDLGYAIAMGEAVGDISRVGFEKLILLTIVIAIAIFILYLIVTLITQWNQTIGGTLMGILGVYITFFTGRATGLLYSEV